MNKSLVHVAAALVLGGGSVMASADDSAKPQGTTANLEMADGEVRKIDLDNRKITVRHGEIKNLQMPGMTMVFQVKDPAMLAQVKVGDKIMFAAEKAGGAIVITSMQAAK